MHGASKGADFIILTYNSAIHQAIILYEGIGGIVDMMTDDIQEELKRIFEYGIHRGNESSITVHELVQELSEKLKILLEKTE